MKVSSIGDTAVNILCGNDGFPFMCTTLKYRIPAKGIESRVYIVEFVRLEV
jgi:hypothetical protein